MLKQSKNIKKEGKKRAFLASSFVTMLRKDYRQIWMALAALVIMIAMSVLFARLVYVVTGENVLEPIFEDLVARHPLTGEAVKEQLEFKPTVFGIMVENAADAWPLSGVDKAFLVVEAPVEGAIPRFIAFFYEGQDVDKIGPVRSARPYYLDWNAEFTGFYGHVGGSPEALSLLPNYDFIDLNQFYQSEYYYRQTTGGRYAPHNVYTNSELLKGVNNEFNFDAPDYGAWKFTDGKSTGNTSVKIDWASGSTYDVSWMYNAETNLYTRHQGNAEMLMTDGAKIQVANVFIVETTINVVDSEGRRHLRTLGEGRAMIVQNGMMTEGTWKKESTTSRLRFYIDGQEVKVNAGRSWIAVIDDLGTVSAIE